MQPIRFSRGGPEFLATISLRPAEDILRRNSRKEGDISMRRDKN